MRIAVCTLTGAPDDVNVWSGTPAHFMNGLRAVHSDVVPIGPLAPKIYQALNRFAGVTGKVGHKVNWEGESSALRFFTRLMDRAIASTNPDVVIAMGWTPLGSKAGVPILYWGDATIGQRLNMSPHWSGLSKRTEKKAADLEGRAICELAGVMMPSRWALDDAVHRYGVTRAHIAPFGSNVPDPSSHPRTSIGETLNLLSMGVKWERKGMDRAVEATDALVARGIKAHLHVAGVSAPSADWDREHVTYHGFISKETAEGRAKLDSLYQQADLFLLPTRNDPFPMVLAEAASYALPAVASIVGGVPDRVEDGVAGVLLSSDATPADYADAIAGILDNNVYAGMSQAARNRYETDFTWEACARRVVDVCRGTLI